MKSKVIFPLFLSFVIAFLSLLLSSLKDIIRSYFIFEWVSYFPFKILNLFAGKTFSFGVTALLNLRISLCPTFSILFLVFLPLKLKTEITPICSWAVSRAITLSSFVSSFVGRLLSMLAHSLLPFESLIPSLQSYNWTTKK